MAKSQSANGVVVLLAVDDFPGWEAWDWESQMARGQRLGVIKLQFYHLMIHEEQMTPISSAPVLGSDQSPISAMALGGKAMDCCVG